MVMTIYNTTFSLYNNNDIISAELHNDAFTTPGVLKINTFQTKTLPIQTFKLYLLLDNSGSMGGWDESPTKLEQVKEITKNMIHWMIKNKNKFFVTIITFDNYQEIIINDYPVNSITQKKILEKIDNITVGGGTDINSAFTLGHNLIQKSKDKKTTHGLIFMTDGVQTVGELCSKNIISNIKSLSTTIKYTQEIIGFGHSHNSELLEAISQLKNKHYHFMDNFETCGSVYTEIIYNIVNKVAEDMRIYIINGKIYDYDKNKWAEHIYLSTFCADQEKIFAIKVDKNNTPIFIINSKKDILNLSKEENTNNSNLDITNNLWRVKVLNILSEIKKETDTSKNQITLHTYLEKLIMYKKETNQETNRFLNLLCDDLKVSHTVMNSIDRNLRNMYLLGRQVSQGSQRGYVVNNHSLSDSSWTSISEHELTEDSQSAFVGRTQMKMCRSISAIDPSYIKKERENPSKSNPIIPTLTRSRSNHPQMAKPIITRPQLFINTNV